jgi:hypothetical protein
VPTAVRPVRIRLPLPPTAILYPAIAMFFLTLGVMLWLGFARYTAIRERSVGIK